jgi:DNA-binding transcriptional regulator YiaG
LEADALGLDALAKVATDCVWQICRIGLEREISRISRKEIRRETSSLKKSSTTHRSEIAALKRRVLELERQLRRVGRAGESPRPTAANEDSVSPGTRFSAKSMAAQRKRLGLSAAQCGLLIGASGQSVYNWEEGKARPRAQHLPAIFALRNLGRRQANEILEARKAA